MNGGKGVDRAAVVSAPTGLRGAALVGYLYSLAGPDAAASLERALQELSAAQWASLDVACRNWGAPAPPLMRSDSSEGVAALASMARDGFLRQRASARLATEPHPHPRVTTRAMALRALDHIGPVRDVAYAYLNRLTDIEDLQAALEVLLAAGERQAAPTARAVVERAILVDVANLPLLRARGDRAVRRWAWHVSEAAGLTPPSDLEAAATTDPDIAVRRWAAERLLSQHTDVDLSRLRASRSVELRVAALTRTPDPDLPGAELRRLLLDPAARVREIARYRAARHDVDLATVYRDALTGPGGRPRGELPLRRVAAAVEGLSLVGDRRDLPLVVTLLGDPRPRVRAAAAGAVAARADGEDVTELLLPLLADPSPRVAATAARVVARAGQPPETEQLEPLWSSPQRWTRRAVWTLARARGGWEALLADLRATQDPDPDASAEAVSVVRGWAHRAAVTGRPSPEVAAAVDGHLRSLYEKGVLDRAPADLIAFTAGVTRYPRERRDSSPPEPDAALNPGRRAGLARMLPRRRKDRER